jgi:uncharacterized repeat protein (TIGR01451 family)
MHVRDHPRLTEARFRAEFRALFGRPALPPHSAGRALWRSDGRTFRVGLLALGLFTSAAVHGAAEPDAQNAPSAVGSGPLELQIVVETLSVDTGPDGAEIRSWVPAGRLGAGDELHYTIRVTNPGKEPVTDIVVTKRLPFGVHYIIGSAVGPGCKVEISIDGGTTFTAPPKPGANAASNRSTRRIPPADYSHVRWIFGKPLAPNATALLRFRATFT